MLKLVSTFVFTAAFFIGSSLTPSEIQTTPTFYEKAFPFFGRREADSMLGRRVNNKFSDEKINGYKYPLKSDGSRVFKYDEEDSLGFVSEKVNLGETGRVVALDKTPDGYLLIVKWDKKDRYGRDLYSYDGRFSSRLFLEFE